MVKYCRQGSMGLVANVNRIGDEYVSPRVSNGCIVHASKVSSPQAHALMCARGPKSTTAHSRLGCLKAVKYRP
jgi:hypothetical protein